MGIKSFLLMNKNKISARFDIMQDGQLTAYQNVQVYGTLPLDMRNISDWISSRYVITERHRAEELMNALGITDDVSKIEFTNCVSLFDSFWVKAEDSSLTWNDVSLYQNDFSKYLSNFTMTGEISLNAPKHERHLSPEYHSEGSFDHSWVQERDGINLLKAGSHGCVNAGKEPFSEVYTNQLEDFLGYTDYVKYYLLRYPRRISGTKEITNSIITSCKAMTTEDVGLISASKLGIMSYEALLDYCEAISATEREKAIKMLLLDCLTLNPDRHMSNVSMFVDNNQVKVTGLSDVYDNNMALVPYYMPEHDGSIIEYSNSLITKLGMDFDDLFLLCYKRSENKQYVTKSLRRIISSFSFQHISFGEELFPRERTDMLTTMVNARAERYLSIVRSL